MRMGQPKSFEEFLGQWEVTLEMLFDSSSEYAKDSLRKAIIKNDASSIRINHLFDFSRNKIFSDTSRWHLMSDEWDDLSYSRTNIPWFRRDDTALMNKLRPDQEFNEELL